MAIKALHYDVQDIGKHVKKSKRRFLWRFSIDGKEHSVELIVSYLSGKKKVTHNGSVLYEGQKVMSTSFQFPFSISSNMCNIVQHGEQFELRINNQVFAHLYDQEKMKREFQYEDGSNQESSGYGGYGSYGGKSSYEGYGSESYSGYKKDDYSSYGKSSYGSYGGYGGQSSNDYYKKESSGTSRNRGWEDVKKAQREVRKEFSHAGSTSHKNDDNDAGLGFDHGFDKFDYTSSKTSGSNAGYKNDPFKDPFGDSKNTYSTDKQSSKFDSFAGFGQEKPKSNTNAFDSFAAPQKSGSNDFGFSDFGKFGDSKPTQSGNDFGSFGGFDDFKKPSNSGNVDFGFGEPQKPATKTTGGDLLGLDFSSPTQQNTNTNQNNAGTFFGNTSNQGGFGDFGSQQTTTTSKPTGKDLLGLDFTSTPTNLGGNNNPSFSTQQTTNTNTLNDDLLGGGPTTTNTTTQQTKPKSSLWDSELVNLNPNEINQPSQNTNQFGGNSQFSTNLNYGGGFGTPSNAGYGMGGGNMGMSMNMNTGFGGGNMNMGMGMNTGFGNPGFNNQGFGMGNQGMVNQGFDTNIGGFGGNTGGLGGISGFGGNPGGFGGMGGGNPGFQQQGSMTSQGNTMSTPFDF